MNIQLPCEIQCSLLNALPLLLSGFISALGVRAVLLDDRVEYLYSPISEFDALGTV